jgi:hypothetical protein
MDKIEFYKVNKKKQYGSNLTQKQKKNPFFLIFMGCYKLQFDP